jgi:hypothetical protein
MMLGGMKQVIATTKDGAMLTPGQLEDAGVEPRERAVVAIRPYSEVDRGERGQGAVDREARRAPAPRPQR